MNLFQRLHKSVSRTFGTQINFPWAPNATYTISDVCAVVIFAAIRSLSIPKASQRLRKKGRRVPEGSVVLHHLSKPGRTRILKRCARAILRHQIGIARKQRLLQKKVDIAIDFNDQPWYGELLHWIVKGKADRGTTRFIRFAHLSIVLPGRRLVVASVPIGRNTPMEEVVRLLLQEARLHMRIRRVYVDRGFYSIRVVRLLQGLGLKFLMPARQTAPVNRAVERMVQRKQYRKRYTIRNSKDSVACNLFIVYDKDEEEWQPFITNLTVTEDNREHIGESYRRRWGIETGFRMKNRYRVKSTSSVYSVRFFLVMVAIILYNFWVLLNAWDAHLRGVESGEPTVTQDEMGLELCDLCETA